ncbi:MAG TPA: phosphoglycerate kinase [Thermoanaerobaculia bacterium]|nr:phosphoglycerate kinase [Thermoanaerobaculia bacterium]
MISIRTIDALHFEPGSRVFYRVDYNVPLDEGRISDATRIEETLGTLRLLRERGAAIVVASHLGRPKGKVNDEYSLRPVREKLAELIGIDVRWGGDCTSKDARDAADALKPGEILLLENLRFHAGEEKNDTAFAEQLRGLGSIYVNDAFGASHRAHASIDALPRLFDKEHAAGGLLLARELQFLQKVTGEAEHPFVALLGGAKIAGKIEPLEALVKHADLVLIGGGMANTFLAAGGTKMGGSLVDEESLEVARRIVAAKGAAIVLPIDLVVADSLENPTRVRTIDVSRGLSAGERRSTSGRSPSPATPRN